MIRTTATRTNTEPTEAHGNTQNISVTSSAVPDDGGARCQRCLGFSLQPEPPDSSNRLEQPYCEEAKRMAEETNPLEELLVDELKIFTALSIKS